MDLWMFIAFVAMAMVYGAVLDNLLRANRAMQEHLRHLSNVADRQADTLDRIETELGMARHDRNDARRS